MTSRRPCTCAVHHWTCAAVDICLARDFASCCHSRLTSSRQNDSPLSRFAGFESRSHHENMLRRYDVHAAVTRTLPATLRTATFRCCHVVSGVASCSTCSSNHVSCGRGATRCATRGAKSCSRKLLRPAASAKCRGPQGSNRHSGKVGDLLGCGHLWCLQARRSNRSTGSCRVDHGLRQLLTNRGSSCFSYLLPEMFRHSEVVNSIVQILRHPCQRVGCQRSGLCVHIPVR